MKRITQLGAALILATGLLGSTPSRAATDGGTIVITPSQLNGWLILSESVAVPVGPSGATFVTGPAAPAASTGSIQFKVTTNVTGELTARPMTNTLFSAFTKLTYATYAQGTAPAASLQFNIDLDTTDAITSYQGRLVFDPSLQTPATVTPNSWQQWNALSGKWWATAPFAGPLATNCSQASPCTLTQILTALPNIGLHPVFGAAILKASASAAGYTTNVDDLIIGISGDNTTHDFEPEAACTTLCFVDAVNGNNNFGGTSLLNPKKSIQAALDVVAANGEVRVLPGAYSETAPAKFLYDGNGPHQFGLFFPDAKPGIRLIGVTAGNVPVTSAVSALATITTNSTSNFGPSGLFVEGDNVTIEGFKIGANMPNTNKTIEVIGDNVTIRNNEIADPEGSVYINDFRYDVGSSTARVKAYRVEGNLFSNSASLDIASGAGASGPLSGRVINGNTFIQAYDYATISFSGSGGVPWFTYPVGGALISGNVFSNSVNGAGQHIRARGAYDNAQFDWNGFWTTNTFNKAVVVSDDPIADARAYSYTSGPYTFTNVRRIGTSIQAEHDHAQPGDSVVVAAGQYSETLNITTSVTLQGAGMGVCAKGRSGAPSVVRVQSGAVTPLNITVDNVTIDGFVFDATGASAPWIGTAFTSGGNPRFDNLRIVNNTFRADTAGGLYLLNQDGLRIECNDFDNLGSHAVFLAAASASEVGSNNVVYRNNDSFSNNLSNFSAHVGPHNNLLVENNRAVEDTLLLFNARNARVINNSFVASTTVNSRVYLGGGNNSVLVDGNTFTDMRNAAVFALDGGFGYGQNGNLTVSNNRVSGDAGRVLSGTALIDLRGTQGNSLVSNNAISYTGALTTALLRGIAVTGPIATVRVNSNTVAGGFVSADSAGLAIGGSLAPTSTLEAHYNVLSGFGNGVRSEGVTAGSTVSVTRNNVAANIALGVNNTGGGLLNAECNWHGAANGPVSPAGGGTGTAVSGGVDFSPWLLSSTLGGACDAISDLAISASGQPTSVNAGSPLTFVVMITNTGATTATNIVLTGTTNISGASVVTFTEIAPGAVVSVTHVLTAPFSANRVTATLLVSADNDPISSNNATSATVAIVLPPTDLQVKASATPTTTFIGGVITYTIMVTNAGPSLAGGVVVTSLLPVGITPVSASLPYSQTSNAFAFTLGTLPISATQTITLSIVAPLTTGTLTNTVSAFTFNDTLPSNNVSIVSVKVTATQVWLPLTSRAP